MMMDKRLLGVVPESRQYIFGNVLCRWLSLMANVGIMVSITRLLASLWQGNSVSIASTAVFILGAVAVQFVCALVSSHMSWLSSRTVKQTLRSQIYSKLLRLGAGYKEQVLTSEVVQVAVEGTDQLETYFGAYLPQFFYAMLAPVSLFCILASISMPVALVLLVCVPLIPVSIALVQTWAKKLLSRYWNQYTALGDTFLENLQGLTTLKIYQSDAWKHARMNEESEKFRKITMKVLTMQLNSITIMDLIAYGGAALGMALGVQQFYHGNVSLAGCLLIILLAADFFLPMRQLGSFFHIAMNGMAASDKIFHLLELPEPDNTGENFTLGDIVCQDLSFSYTPDTPVLQDVNLTFKTGELTAIVGESGCGKSTLASLLMSRSQGYTGSITINGTELSGISQAGLMEQITYVGHQSYIFQGTIRENLALACPQVDEAAMWKALQAARLDAFAREAQGLDTLLEEGGSNLSGGQRQRLALARALLHDSAIYIFDESTSNIDVESENDIMELIHAMAETKTVIVISHRLANVMDADCIYVLQDGRVAEHGSHQQLLDQNSLYATLWNTQQNLENFGKEKQA